MSQTYKSGGISMKKKMRLQVILDRIKNLRLERGYSQDVLAKGINISQNSYFKIEKGITKLTLENFLKIASFLNVDESSLLDKDDKKLLSKD